MDHKYYLVDSSGLKESVENESSRAPLKPEENVNNLDSRRHNDAHNHSIMGNLSHTKKCCLPQLENSEQNVGNFSSKTTTEVNEFNCDVFVGEDKLATPMNISATEASRRPHVASLMSISSKEMCTVLKNYGLGHPVEIEEDLLPEIYFGSVCLWPWEIIYCSRLINWPISNDSYARRLYQNEGFGIVDKHIRSSSGWGELTNENP